MSALTTREYFSEILDILGRCPSSVYQRNWRTRNAIRPYMPSIRAPRPRLRRAALHRGDAFRRRCVLKACRSPYLTLACRIGTLPPRVRADITQHKMHAGILQHPCGDGAGDQRREAEGRRIIAVGTTSCRTLGDGEHRSLAISRWQETERLDGYLYLSGLSISRWWMPCVTNFHLPKSTLVMLVSAMAGRETDACLREAVKRDIAFSASGIRCLFIRSDRLTMEEEVLGMTVVLLDTN